jgi:hypothetical protein
MFHIPAESRYDDDEPSWRPSWPARDVCRHLARQAGFVPWPVVNRRPRSPDCSLKIQSQFPAASHSVQCTSNIDGGRGASTCRERSSSSMRCSAEAMERVNLATENVRASTAIARRTPITSRPTRVAHVSGTRIREGVGTNHRAWAAGITVNVIRIFLILLRAAPDRVSREGLCKAFTTSRCAFAINHDERQIAFDCGVGRLAPKRQGRSPCSTRRLTV